MSTNDKNCSNANSTILGEIDNLLKKYVRIKTYLSLRPIYGKILESTDNTITVAPRYIGSIKDVNYDKLTTYLLPKSSIIDIREAL